MCVYFFRWTISFDMRFFASFFNSKRRARRKMNYFSNSDQLNCFFWRHRRTHCLLSIALAFTLFIQMLNKQNDSRSMSYLRIGFHFEWNMNAIAFAIEDITSERGANGTKQNEIKLERGQAHQTNAKCPVKKHCSHN